MDNKDNKKITIKGDLNYDVVHETPNLTQHKSGGNNPSGLDAVKKKQVPQGINNSSIRSTLTRPSDNILSNKAPSGATRTDVSNGSSTSKNGTPSSRTNNSKNTIKKASKKKTQNLDKKRRIQDQINRQNPNLNQNKFKDFGRKNTPKNPSVNPSAKFTSKSSGRGFFSGKKSFNIKGPNLLSGITSKRKKSNDDVNIQKVKKAKASMDFIRIFMALPLAVKIVIIGFLASFFILMILIIIILAAHSSASDGNREMKDQYIYGNVTEEELCDYLARNGYLDGESNETIECENSLAYKYFVNFKELKNEYETEYSQYRYSVNVELLYETLAYYNADQEFYEVTTKEEIDELINASLESIEESCVIKTYNKKTGVCDSKKYVYPLYEISLNKYISYLKYGETSSHPNYNKELVKRKCGEGNNVDYVFGYGLVNTSSSPLREGSDCPNNPVKPSDYEDPSIPVKRTTLEEMDILGGVPYFSRINKGNEVSDNVEIPHKSESGSQSNSTIDVPKTGIGSDIAKYALEFVGNPYLWGGTSLTEGSDCSGFIMSVYKKFNYSLPHSSEGIAHMGTEITCSPTSLQPGDVVAYGSSYNDISHIALYVGNGNVVHAMGKKYGITVSRYDYSSKKYKVCKRLVH